MKRKTDPPQELSREEKLDVQHWISERHPRLLTRPRLIADMWEYLVDWHLENGKQKINWASTLKNWIRREAKGRANEPPPWWADSAQESSSRSKTRSEPEAIGVLLLKMIEGGKE